MAQFERAVRIAGAIRTKCKVANSWAMVSEFERKHHEVLAGLISHVLRCREGLIRVPDLAQQTGFSRFHLARLFGK